ncbi:hypothetical protein H072_1100 [Dactylellina haptotyla CBS 200.50]|uniref:Mid2 domain-containing protein n=1 Tax=Dactylellina haptotyla (strain CBS 200.50) TaxID=1284197 RepID=S8AVD2_DACHA|nr:hypothetical protein H072_1100 [Dactylellina haptotyla CBS 200.50]
MIISQLPARNPLLALLVLFGALLQLTLSVHSNELHRRQIPGSDAVISSTTSRVTSLGSSPSLVPSNTDVSDTSPASLPTEASSTDASSGELSSIAPPFGNSTTTSSPVGTPTSATPELTSTITKVPLTTQVTVTHIVTDEFGRKSTSIDVVPTTTMVPSNDPSLANGGESGSASGVTPQQKKIIIGVVVSVVGILSIIGIAGVIWRIWFSRRGVEENRSLEHKATLPPSTSRLSVQNNDNITITSSGSDRRKKTSFGTINPSSNF